MHRKMWSGGVRPSRAMSWLTAVVGIGMLLVVGTFFLEPFLAVGAFMFVWVIAVVCIIAYHVWNATHPQGVPHTHFDVQTSGHDQPIPFEERLRELEALRRDELISKDEYQQKRKEIMDQKW